MKTAMHDTAAAMKRTMRCAARAFHARAAALAAPVSADEDRRRQEFVLNVILVFSIAFLAILDLMVSYNSIKIHGYYGISFAIFSCILVGYVSMFIASKKGHARTVSYILIGTFAVGSIYGGWVWGASLPATLLMFALVSTTASVLIGSRFGFIVSGLLVIILVVLGVHEVHTLGIQAWKYEMINATDVILYGSIILFIAGISWLSNRELDKSLSRARRSEKALAHERDNLEITVAVRTEELKKSQAERMAELSRIAELGKLSRGLFHDLMTPLTSVALYMERLQTLTPSISTPASPAGSSATSSSEISAELSETYAYIKKAVSASERMAAFMLNIRRYMSHGSPAQISDISENEMTCNIISEASMAIDLLAYKARMAGVTMEIRTPEEAAASYPPYPGNPLYFHQIFLNLISNAIDAYSGMDEATVRDAIIRIDVISDVRGTRIRVSDNGPGISKECIGKIFDPFFTTKSAALGSGIGLYTVKNIVEEKLHGKISVESSPHQTIFTITLP